MNPAQAEQEQGLPRDELPNPELETGGDLLFDLGAAVDDDHDLRVHTVLLGNIGLTRANVRDPVGLLGYSDRIELYMRPKLGTSQVFYMAYQIFEKLKLDVAPFSDTTIGLAMDPPGTRPDSPTSRQRTPKPRRRIQFLSATPRSPAVPAAIIGMPAMCRARLTGCPWVSS